MSVWGTESWEHDRDDRERKRCDGFPGRIDRSTVITVLSGAGISAESGVPTFRGASGIWNDKNVAEIATPRGFAADPMRGWRFYDERRQNIASCKPNPAHIILARLEEAGYDITVITQNVDRLHHAAGSTRVIELHGSLWMMRCSNPRCSSKPFENRDVPLKEIPPLCDKCGRWLRPDVVFFEEPLDPADVQAADARTKITDLFLVIGTSGVVYPAAAFAQVAAMCGAHVVEFNLEKTPLTPYCSESLFGPCGETLPAYVARVTGGQVVL